MPGGQRTKLHNNNNIFKMKVTRYKSRKCVLYWVQKLQYYLPLYEIRD